MMIKNYKHTNQFKARKTIFLVLLLFAFIHSTTAQNVNEWTTDKLKGKVKSLTEIWYEAVENEGKIEKVNRATFNSHAHDIHKKYNQNGNIIERNEYKSDGSLFTKKTYTYNENGILIGGNEYHYFEDSSVSTNIYKYDKKDQKIEGKTLNAEGSLQQKTTFKYDKQGNEIEVNWLGDNGQSFGQTRSKYDKKGNKVEEKHFHANKKLLSTFLFKYDENGNKVEVKLSNADGSFAEKYSFIYDEKGNEIESNWYDFDGSLINKMTLKYDENGNVIEESTFKADGSLMQQYVTNYEYDKFGNWIKTTTYKNGNFIYVNERKLEYYEISHNCDNRKQ